MVPAIESSECDADLEILCWTPVVFRDWFGKGGILHEWTAITVCFGMIHTGVKLGNNRRFALYSF